MYTVHFTNFGYRSSKEFDSVDEAVQFGKDKGFEFNVQNGSLVVASWSPIGGLRFITKERVNG
jgi:hypothetical protein